MVVQKRLDLNKPLDANTPAKICHVPMNPSLATLALTLHGDYYRQLQSKSNSRILWDSHTQLVVITAFFGFIGYLFHDLYEVSDSIGEFFTLAWRNKTVLIHFFPAFVMVGGVVGLVSASITDDFRAMSDLLDKDEVIDQLFGFALRRYASSNEEDFNTPFVQEGSESTDLIEYRDSHIGVVTVVSQPEKSDFLTYFAKITGLHVRKSYSKAGLEADLLDYAKIKAIKLSERYAKEKKIPVLDLKIVLLAESYSVDHTLPTLYLESGFKIVNSDYHVNAFEEEDHSERVFNVVPIRWLYKVFNIQRIYYELEIKI